MKSIDPVAYLLRVSADVPQACPLGTIGLAMVNPSGKQAQSTPRIPEISGPETAVLLLPLNYGAIWCFRFVLDTWNDRSNYVKRKGLFSPAGIAVIPVLTPPGVSRPGTNLYAFYSESLPQPSVDLDTKELREGEHYERDA